MTMINRAGLILFLTSVFIVLTTTYLLAQNVGERVVKRGEIEDDVYLAGGEVEVDATVNGDVTAAGGELNLAGEIRGDVNAAGGSLTLRGAVADDVRLAGGELRILATVDDDVIAAGGRIELDRDARVGGRAWLSGGDIRVDSSIAQELRASGGRIRISGSVQGDVYLVAEHIEISSDAVISGNLITKGPREPRIAEGARIEGELRHTMADVSMAPIIAGLAGVALLFLLSMMVAAVVLYLLFPRFAEHTAQYLRDQPWVCLGIGLAVFAATPVVILILLITILGFWLGLLLVLVYLMLLFLGYLMGAFFVADSGLRLLRKKEPGKAGRVISLVVAILLLAIIGLIPLLGGLIGWLVLLLGMGALTYQMNRIFQARSS